MGFKNIKKRLSSDGLKILEEVLDSNNTFSIECPGQDAVYHLTEPEEALYNTRYVGRTIYPTPRYKQHLLEAYYNPTASRKNIWISNLIKVGTLPRMEIAFSGKFPMTEVESFSINEEIFVGCSIYNIQIPRFDLKAHYEGGIRRLTKAERIERGLSVEKIYGYQQMGR